MSEFGWLSDDDRTPWSGHDLVSLARGSGLSAVLLSVCWFGSSGTGHWSTQLGWTAGAIGALLIGLVSMSVWVVTGLRCVKRERSVVLRRRLEAIEARGIPSPAEPRADEFQVWLVEGGSRHHRRECLLLQGKSPVAGSTADATRPCGVCRP